MMPATALCSHAPAGYKEWSSAPLRDWACVSMPMLRHTPVSLVTPWDERQPFPAADPAVAQEGPANPATAATAAQQQEGRADGFGITLAAHGTAAADAESTTASGSSTGGERKGGTWACLGGIAHERVASFNTGFCAWADQLHPSIRVETVEHAVVQKVRQAAIAACRGQPWHVTAVQPAGELQQEDLPAARVSACTHS